MKTILTLLFFSFALSAFAQSAVHKQIDQDGKPIVEKTDKHKADSIAALLIPFPIALTPAQEKKLNEFDAIPAKLREAEQKAMQDKVAYILGIIDALKAPPDIEKVKEYEHKPNQLILKLSK